METQPDKDPKSKKNIVWIILSIILAIALIGGTVFYFYQSNKTKKDKDNLNKQIQELNKKVDELEKVKTQSTTTTTTNTTDVTANWKTYTDTGKGFSFKYPPNWSLSTSNASSDFVNSPDYKSHKGGPGGGSDIVDQGASIEMIAYPGGPNPSANQTSNLTVDGQRAYQQENASTSGGSGDSVVTMFGYKGKEYEIRLWYPSGHKNDYIKEYNQLINTFKLL